MEAEGVSERETVRANGVRSRTVRVKGRVCGDIVCQWAGGVILQLWRLGDEVIFLTRLELDERKATRYSATHLDCPMVQALLGRPNLLYSGVSI